MGLLGLFGLPPEVWNFDDAEFIYQTLENTPVGAVELNGWDLGRSGERWMYMDVLYINFKMKL